MDLTKFAAKVKELNVNVKRIAVYQNGKTFSLDINGAKQPYNCYSISKNFTATAVGLLVDDGKLSVDAKIVDILKDCLPSSYDGKLADVTVENLLMQRMGNQHGYLFEGDRYSCGTDDWVNFVLSQPLYFKPGSKFVYSNSTFYLLSVIVEKNCGKSTFDFLNERLFLPFGFENHSWQQCPKGHTFGASSLFLTTDDMLKLGVLYLNKGVYNGKRYLSEQWVEAATSLHSGTENDEYCYSFWRKSDMWYQGNGANNQRLFVMPNKNAVVAIHSYDPNFCDLFAIVQQTVDL